MDHNQRFYIAVAIKPPEQSDSSFAVEIGGLIIATFAFLSAWAFNHITSGWKEDVMELRAHVGKIEASHIASYELFVRREDYLRGMESIDKKLDDLAEHQDKQIQRQDTQFQILLSRLTASKNDTH